ncbi:MAG: methyl-accepting chemotaxis protein [Desulfobacterales bacterium]|nr:methyl-accepting chemotaxis protein [Desulfobacterales bacterium]
MKILRGAENWAGEERRRLTDRRGAGERFRARFRLSRLRKRLLIYFMLVVFVSFSVGLQLIYEVGSDDLLERITESVRGRLPENVRDDADISGIADILGQLQKRMMLVMAIVLICIVATLFVFIKNIVTPLDEIRRVAKKMADGYLDEMVPVTTKDEIGKIADLINDLAINLQEVLIHLWRHTGQDIELLDQVVETIRSDRGDALSPDIGKNIDLVRQDIEDMQDMVKDFKFYDIHLDEGGGKVMEGPEPEGKES